MELRIEKTALCIVALFAPFSGVAATFEYAARHDHWRKECSGTLRFDDSGASYTQNSGKKQEHRFAWRYEDMQQLEVSDGGVIRVLSYKDRVMLAGKDQPYEFKLDDQEDLTPLYRDLRAKLDQRFIARLADISGTPQWQAPVKLLGTFLGTEGTLTVFADRVVYSTAEKGESRTWRDIDIRNVSSSGPFDFHIETFEINGKFHFQLKHALDQQSYDALWHRLNRPRGLALISTSKEKQQ
jgi:hypothetical protein